MEATPQATQREITLGSLALVKAARADVHVFNELLVQYPVPRSKKPGQVVPDNMVVIHPGPLKAEGSYDVPLQPAAPFWMLEYVSKSSKRKDYDDNMEHYERRLKVPYYLLFYPETQDLTLYRHNGRKYVSVKPNEQGRCAIPELELEVGLHEGWVRYWLRGRLLPLPAELQRALDEAQRRLGEATRQREEAERQRDEANRRGDEERRARQAAEEESARLRAELERLRRSPSNP
jgi:hypothetical protein